MRIVRVEINNVTLFNQKFAVDFVNSDLVRKNREDNENILPAYRVKSGIYTQVLMAFTGLNATGKTTALELLSAITQVILQGKSLNDASIQQVFLKLIPVLKERKLEWKIFFIHEHTFYHLHSVISSEDILNTAIENNGFKFIFEELKGIALSKVSRKNFKDVSQFKTYINRSQEKDNPYLQEDVSIASSLKGVKGTVFPLGQNTNFNFPAWLGVPSEEALHVFDPNIQNLSIRRDKDGNSQYTLSFKNRDDFTYGGSPMGLVNLLSSGMIKGLTILPGIIRTLKLGGYVFIDEIENHFNKKIIEWFFKLFMDKTTNPKGACLIFSTHYPELLDSFIRKDNIYITRRDKENYFECVRYSDFVKRNELLKSKVILENVINGTAPRYQDLENGRKWIASIVNKEGVL